MVLTFLQEGSIQSNVRVGRMGEMRLRSWVYNGAKCCGLINLTRIMRKTVCKNVTAITIFYRKFICHEDMQYYFNQQKYLGL